MTATPMDRRPAATWPLPTGAAHVPAGAQVQQTAGLAGPRTIPKQVRPVLCPRRSHSCGVPHLVRMGTKSISIAPPHAHTPSARATQPTVCGWGCSWFQSLRPRHAPNALSPMRRSHATHLYMAKVRVVGQTESTSRHNPLISHHPPCRTCAPASPSFRPLPSPVSCVRATNSPCGVNRGRHVSGGDGTAGRYAGRAFVQRVMAVQLGALGMRHALARPLECSLPSVSASHLCH